MAKKIVTLWLEDDLLEAVDALTAEMGYLNERTGEPNRSAAIRHILRRAVGEKATASSLREEVTSFHARLASRREAIDQRFMEILEEELAG